MEPDFPEIAVTSEGTATVHGGRAEHPFVPGASASMRAVEQAIRQLAGSEVPVLVLGESGAGKRTAAQRIHHLSGRRNQPFVGVECSTLTPEAVEGGTESLFGWGTVMLEEVCGLSAACQAKLLEMLPEGNGQGRSLAARLVFASARDLEEEVRGLRFREDLYYRISGVCLRLPPLRQRKEDILRLVTFFLAKYAADFRRPLPKLSAETQRWFQEYGWPGNIRELEDAAKAIVVLGDETLAMGGLRSLRVKSDRGSNGEKISLKDASRAASREAEKELILKVLNRTRWNRRRAALELQISYKALLYKLKQIGFEEYGAS